MQPNNLQSITIKTNDNNIINLSYKSDTKEVDLIRKTLLKGVNE